MKITFARDKLLTAFQLAAAVAPKNTPKEILTNVRLDARDSGATIMATDLEVGVRSDLADVEVERAGSVLLPVARFGSILRESSDDKLRIESTNEGAVIRGDRSTFKVPTADAHEFPEVATFNEKKYHTMPARVLKELIRRTVFSTDPDSGRYALGGVLFEMDGDHVNCVGTDGRRLAKMEASGQSVGGHTTGETTTIIPTHSLQLIERTLTEPDAEVKISCRTSDVILSTPQTTIFTRLVEGRFPKWRDVFPKRPDAAKIDLTVGPTFAALRQAAVMTSQESRGVDLTFADGTLTISALTADIGQSRVELPVAYTGKELRITLDHRYLADFFKVLDPEKTFVMELDKPEGPALLTTDDGYSYVVMPLQRDR